MEYLIGLVGLLIGALIFTNSKKKSAEALLQNQEVKEKALEIDKDIAKNLGSLEAEDLKRKELQDAPKKDNTDPVDFLNNR